MTPTETVAEFLSRSEKNGYEIAPKEYGYEEISSRGARFRVAELPHPRVNRKRREFILSAFSFLSPIWQGVARLASRGESSSSGLRESSAPPSLRSAPRKSALELSLFRFDNPFAVNSRFGIRCQ